MIFTCTLNPSIDYLVKLEQFEQGKVNRAESVEYFPGGKGINVSRVLKNIGIDSVALGYVGGFTGSFIKDFLNKEHIQFDFIEHEEPTRINVKLKTNDESEINGSGAFISIENQQRLLEKLEALTTQDFLVLAGSLPHSVTMDFYKSIAELCSSRNIPFIIDVSGPALREVLSYAPFLIKPNQHELGEIFGTSINSKEQAIQYGKKMVEEGAKHVIVSMGGDGAVFVSSDLTAFATVPKGNVKNSVGAGDSTVAGFIASYVQHGDLVEAFKFGVASGSATAFSSDLCKKHEIEGLLSKIKIDIIS